MNIFNEKALHKAGRFYYTSLRINLCIVAGYLLPVTSNRQL